MNTSIIICTWKRYGDLNTLLNYYSRYSDDIILWDNGGQALQYIEPRKNLLIITPNA